MKNYLTAVLLSLLMAVGLVLPAVAGEMEVTVEEVETKKPPLGEDLTDYVPMDDPCYGLLRVYYEDITSEINSGDGTIAMKKCYFPVLLKDGHVLTDVYTLCGEMGMTVTVEDNGWTIESHERKMKMFENTDVFFYTLGEGNNAVSFLRSDLSCKTSMIDGVLWAPLNDISIMMGLNGQIYTIDGEPYYTFYAHREDALDVLAEVKRDSTRYGFDYVDQISLTDDQMQTLYISSGVSTLFDRILKFDVETWKSLIVSAIPLTGDAGMAIWEESMCYDLVQALVGQGVDEAWISSAENMAGMGDVTNLIYLAASGAEQAKIVSLQDIYGEVSSFLTDSKSLNEALFGQFFHDTARGIKNCRDNAEFLSGVGDAVGEGLFFAVQAFSLGNIAVNYLQREQYSLDTLKAVLEQMPDNCHLPDNCVESMKKNLDEYEKNIAQYSFGTYIRKNGGDLVSFGTGIVSKAFALGTVPLALYNLGSTFIPEINQNLKSMKDFQLSIYARDLQYDVQNYMRNQIPGSQTETITKEQLEKALDSTYLYLKTCYVARSLGLSALSKEELSFPAQRSINQNILRKLAILINARGGDTDEIPLILPAECVSAVENSSDRPLYDMAIPLYMHLDGKVLNREDHQPVPDANGKAFDQSGRELGTFQGGTDGTYQVTVPFFEDTPISGDTVLEEHFQVTLQFTSDTVEGTGQVTAAFNLTADQKMDDCYLGDPVKNNGGTVVGYGEDVYYWRFTNDSMNEGGLFASFYQNESTVNELVCRHPDGSERVVATGCIYTGRKLYIANGRIYWNSSYMQVDSVEMDGSNFRSDSVGVIEGIDEKTGCLIGRDEGLFALNSMDGSQTRLTSQSTDQFLLADNGVVYYSSSPDYDIMCIYAVNEDGSGVRKLAEWELMDSLGVAYYTGQEAQIAGDSLYVSYGGYAGTGLFFQPGGGIARVNLNGSGAEKIVPESEEIKTPYFFISEEEGTDFLYYYAGENYDSLAGMWDWMGFYLPCRKMNLDTGVVVDTDFVLSDPGTKICQNGQIQAILGDTAEYTTLISAEGLSSIGCPKVGELENKDYIVLRDVELVSNTVYFTVDYGIRDSAMDMGWRPYYKRGYSRLYECEPGGDTCHMIYEY